VKNIRDFMKGYQPRTNIVKDEKGKLVADSHSILARWRNYFSQLFSVHGDNDVRQTEIQTGEPLVHEPSATEFRLAIGKLKFTNHQVLFKYQWNWFKVGGRTIHGEIHKLITIYPGP
jgi:hypothetical protein